MSGNGRRTAGTAITKAAPVDGSVWGEESGGDCKASVMRGGSWYVKRQGLAFRESQRVTPH